MFAPFQPEPRFRHGLKDADNTQSSVNDDGRLRQG